jgi:hypothetical protein
MDAQVLVLLSSGLLSYYVEGCMRELEGAELYGRSQVHTMATGACVFMLYPLTVRARPGRGS